MAEGCLNIEGGLEPMLTAPLYDEDAADDGGGEW
jgi:hypothetical protein